MIGPAPGGGAAAATRGPAREQGRKQGMKGLPGSDGRRIKRDGKRVMEGGRERERWDERESE